MSNIFNKNISTRNHNYCKFAFELLIHLRLENRWPEQSICRMLMTLKFFIFFFIFEFKKLKFEKNDINDDCSPATIYYN